MTIFSVHNISDLSREVKKKLYYLTLDGYDLMREYLSTIIKTKDEMPKFVLAYQQGKIVGWALACIEYGEKECDVYVFVQKRYRRNGIGTKLICKARRIVKSRKKTPIFFVWDKRSDSFYNSMPKLTKEIYNF